MFNQGLPEQFSFVTTFRNRNRGRGRRWHLIRVTDSRGQPQFAVGLDPNRKTVEFSIKKYDGTLQTLTWERPQVRCCQYHIEPEIRVCTQLREMSSCYCLTFLAGPAWVLRSKTDKPLFAPLYYITWI